MIKVARGARTSAIVVACLVLSGSAVAQGSFAGSLAGGPVGVRIVEAIRASWAEEGGDGEVSQLVMEITEQLYRGVTGDDTGTPDPDDVCAFLVGTGGTVPRLDGGGEWLSVRPPALYGTEAVGHSGNRVGTVPGPTLVIVDDFDLANIVGGIESARSSDAVPVDPAGVDLWSVLVGDEFARQGGSAAGAITVRHGHVVAFHALSLLPAGSRITGATNRSGTHAVLDVRIPPDGAGSDVVLTVHLLDIDFEVVSTIATAMEVLQGLENGVVVLSWGIVDCFASNGYAGIDGPDAPETLAEYVAKRLRDRPEVEALVRELCRAVATVLTELEEQLGLGACDGDFDAIAVLGPLAYFAGLNERTEASIGRPDGGALRFFAAAGNQGLGFSMPPAAWSGIHAVGACVLIDSTAQFAPFSNRGTTAADDDAVPVTALGAWFETVERHHDDLDQSLGYWGTSFAAPAAAVHFLALGLQDAYPPCGPAE